MTGEHVWRHTRGDDKYVTVIIDLTPIYGWAGAFEAVGHGRGPLETGVRAMARSAPRRPGARAAIVRGAAVTGEILCTAMVGCSRAGPCRS